MTIYQNDGFTKKPKNPAYSQGTVIRTVPATVNSATVANGGSFASGDVVVLAKSLPLSWTVHELFVHKQTNVTGSNVTINIGFAKDNGNVILNSSALAINVPVSGTVFVGDALGNGISNFDETLTIGELLGLTVEDQPQEGVDIIAKISGAASGVIAMDVGLIVE